MLCQEHCMAANSRSIDPRQQISNDQNCSNDSTERSISADWHTCSSQRFINYTQTCSFARTTLHKSRVLITARNVQQETIWPISCCVDWLLSTGCSVDDAAPASCVLECWSHVVVESTSSFATQLFGVIECLELAASCIICWKYELRTTGLSVNTDRHTRLLSPNKACK